MEDRFTIRFRYGKIALVGQRIREWIESDRPIQEMWLLWVEEYSRLKITKVGIILAVKNLGMWCASWKMMQIEIEPKVFLWGLIIYAMINVPTDLYIANHLSSQHETA